MKLSSTTTVTAMYLLETSELTKELYNSRNRTKMSYTPRKEIALLKEKNLLNNKDGEAHVGFSDLPNQIHRRTIKKAFEFTLLVCGEWAAIANRTP